LALQNRNIIRVRICRRDVLFAVLVKISDFQRIRRRAGRKVERRRKRSVARAN